MTAKRAETGRKGALSARMDRVALALAEGWTKARTVRECRVGKTTIDRWMSQEPFRQRVDQLRRQIVDRAVGRLSGLMAKEALNALTARLRRKDAETGELAAGLDDIKAAFELFANVSTVADFKARLEKLEGKK
jgi:hypothetical protein